jgi:hypothetical protein
MRTEVPCHKAKGPWLLPEIDQNSKTAAWLLFLFQISGFFFLMRLCPPPPPLAGSHRITPSTTSGSGSQGKDGGDERGGSYGMVICDAEFPRSHSLINLFSLLEKREGSSLPFGKEDVEDIDNDTVSKVQL